MKQLFGSWPTNIHIAFIYLLQVQESYKNSLSDQSTEPPNSDTHRAGSDPVLQMIDGVKCGLAHTPTTRRCPKRSAPLFRPAHPAWRCHALPGRAFIPFGCEGSDDGGAGREQSDSITSPGGFKVVPRAAPRGGVDPKATKKILEQHNVRR